MCELLHHKKKWLHHYSDNRLWKDSTLEQISTSASYDLGLLQMPLSEINVGQFNRMFLSTLL